MESYNTSRTGSILLRGTVLHLRLPCPDETFHGLQYLLQTALLAFGYARQAQLSIDHVDEQFDAFTSSVSLTFGQMRYQHGDRKLRQVFWLWLHRCLKLQQESNRIVREVGEVGDQILELQEDLIALGYAISFCFDAIKVLATEALPAYTKLDDLLPQYCNCSVHSALASGPRIDGNEFYQVPVVPSQNPSARNEERLGMVNSSLTTTPDQIIAGIPLERETQNFYFQPPLDSGLAVSGEMDIQPPTEKEKELLFRAHKELEHAQMEPRPSFFLFAPPVPYRIPLSKSTASSSTGGMNKSRTRSAPSFVYASSSSSTTKTSTLQTDCSNEMGTSSMLNQVTDEELLFETRRRRDNYLQARMRLAETVTSRYKPQPRLRRVKSSDSLRSIDSREGIAPTKCYSYGGKGGSRDVRMPSYFSPSRLPLNQDIKLCSTPINDPSSSDFNDGIFNHQRGVFRSQSYQRWLAAPAPDVYTSNHGLERDCWMLTDPSTDSSSSDIFPAPSLLPSL